MAIEHDDTTGILRERLTVEHNIQVGT